MSKKLKWIISLIIISIFVGYGAAYLLSSEKNEIEIDENYTPEKAYQLLEGNFDAVVEDENDVLTVISENEDMLGIDCAEEELEFVGVNQIDGVAYYKFQQQYQTIPVFGRYLKVPVYEDGTVGAITGNYYKTGLLEATYTKKEEQVLNGARKWLGDKAENCSVEAPQKVIYNLNGHKAACCWEISIRGAENGELFLYDDKLTQSDWIPLEIEYADDANGSSDTQAVENYSYQGQGNSQERIISVRKNGDTYTMENARNHFKMYKQSKENKDRWQWLDTEEDAAELITWNSKEKPDKYAVDFAYSIEVIDNFWRNQMERRGIYGDDTLLYLMLAADTRVTDYGRPDETQNFSDNAMYYVTASGAPLIATAKATSESEHYEDEIIVIAHEYAHGIQNHDAPMFNDRNDEIRSIKEAIGDIFGVCVGGYLDILPDNWGIASRQLEKPSSDSLSYTAANSGHSESWNYAERMEEFVVPDPESFYDSKDSEEDRDKINSRLNNLAKYLNSTILSHTVYSMYQGTELENYTKNETGIRDYEKLLKLWYHAIQILSCEPTFSECRSAVEFTAQRMEERNELSHCQVMSIQKIFDEAGINPVSTKTRCLSYYVRPHTGFYVYDKNQEIYPIENYTIEYVAKDDTETNNSIETIAVIEDGKYVLNLESEHTYTFCLTDLKSKRMHICKVEAGEEQSPELKIYTNFGLSDEELTGGIAGNSVVQKDGWTYFFMNEEKTDSGYWHAERTTDAVSVDRGLYRVSTDGVKVERLTDRSGCDVQVVGDYVYFISVDSDGSKKDLYQIRTDGSEEKILIEGFQGSYAVYDRMIYYVQRYGYYYQGDTEAQTELNKSLAALTVYDIEKDKYTVLTDEIPHENEVMTPFTSRIWIYQGKLYQSYSEQFVFNYVYQMDLDGNNRKVVYEDPGTANGFYMDGEWLYYNRPYVSGVGRYNINTKESEMFLEDASKGTIGFLIQDDFLYYAIENAIYRMPKDGGDAECIVENGDIQSIDSNNSWYNNIVLKGISKDWMFYVIFVDSGYNCFYYEYRTRLSDGKTVHCDGRDGMQYMLNGNIEEPDDHENSYEEDYEEEIEIVPVSENSVNPDDIKITRQDAVDIVIGIHQLPDGYWGLPYHCNGMVNFDGDICYEVTTPDSQIYYVQISGEGYYK